jgi:hypothetical protein
MTRLTPEQIAELAENARIAELMERAAAENTRIALGLQQPEECDDDDAPPPG